ncbi:Thyroid hormone receptor-associated protein 3, partial [Dissostichus eleginoides]
KKYPRGYQNGREFRGYHRGFRRPYNFRGRGRGFFPRGRYQRGGGGGGYNNNNNFRPNWKNYKQQHSQHSSSSSHSSSPKWKPALLLTNPNAKDGKEELSVSKEAQKGGGGDEEPAEPVGVLAGEAKESACSGKADGNWQGLSDCSPKRTSTLASYAVIVGQNSQSTNQSSPSPKITKDISNGAPSWRMVGSSSSTKKPSHEGLNPMLSSFDFFSNEEYLDGDKTAISIAFRQFLEEQNKKAKALENGKNTEREMAGHFEELSPDMAGKARKMTSSPSIPSPTPPPRRNPDVELRGEDTPFMSSRKQEPKVNVRMDFLGERLMSSDILAEERQLSQDLVQSSKKDQEFRSIFHHVQAPQLQRSPSELFAQHIVSIVHHIKAQHFPSAGMTINERFTMFQRRAAEKELMKPRKSPEIHRRIDVSPRAFKKHSQLFEAMKSSEDGTYKDGVDKVKEDPMDLRLDIERRKKYSSHDREYKQDRGRDVGESPDSSRERSLDKFSKSRKRSKKREKKRSRSSSSSSSSSSKSQKEDLPHGKSDPKEKAFDRGRLGQTESTGPDEGGRPRGGFQVRIRGRSWNGGNNQGNSSHSNAMANMEVDPKAEDWDPEFTPKSRKYYLHDDREREAECKWFENRGRGRGSASRGRARFIIRKATGGPNTNSPKRAHDKFQINGEKGSAQEEERQQDHKDGGIEGEKT